MAPAIVGKGVTVVDHDGLTIEELVGNVSSGTDLASLAMCKVSKPTKEPYLTLDYDEWMVVLKGEVRLNYGEGKYIDVQAGETAFVPKGDRFQPEFRVAGTEYIPLCLPAFRPDRCAREDDPSTSPVVSGLQKLHGAPAPVAPTSEQPDKLYHMCQRSAWEAAKRSGEAYFPPTFEADGHYTHATSVAKRLITTANHFYTSWEGEWICLELSRSKLLKCGIVTKDEDPGPVGAQDVSQEWTTWVCPHIYGGIPASVVEAELPMTRDEKGNFLTIEGL